jgi:subtilisin family serine protease
MTVNYRTDYVMARADGFQPGDIGRLNKILADAGLGSPLSDPDDSQAAGVPAALIRVPVRDGADPLAIEAALRSAQPDGEHGPAVVADRQSSAGTLVPGDFFAAGKKSGHGMGWVPAPADEMPSAPDWDPDGPHPVIAVLDSGVQPHLWLPEHPPLALDLDGTDSPPSPPETPSPPEPAGHRFLLDADGMDGWHSPIAPADPARPPYPPGTHWGHGTFIAGLIRQAAPHAQVLSLRVMNAKGVVDDSAVVDALTWLHSTTAIRPDVVLMAFGRQATADDPTLAGLRAAVAALTDQGVTVVASAGNNGSDQPVYPAAFAAELGPKMISVGALMSREFRAPYSNFGPWVTTAWLGTDIVSIHPQTIRSAGDHQTEGFAVDNPPRLVAANSFAWWTGTSFAAAIAAGHLARGQAAGLPLPTAVEQP